MASVDNIEVNSKVGLDGNSYTTAISNDKLTNDDFLKLMLEELKMQDPTKPMDSQRMLDSQMQMSNIETNLSLVNSMESLSQAFTQSALSNAANIINKNVEDGNINEAGINKAYTVRSVASEDGEVVVTAQEILFLEDVMRDPDGNTINYDLEGNILNDDGTLTGNRVSLSAPGSIVMSDGKPTIINSNNELVESLDYEVVGSIPVYSDQLTTIPFSAITKVF